MADKTDRKVEVVLRSLDELHPYAMNPRLNDGAVSKVRNSIVEYGFTNPIIVDADGVIIAGHTRYAAAQELGLSEVPVITVDWLTETQVKALRIADNKTAEWSKWDVEKLGEELAELVTAEFDNMESLGFSESELERIFSGIGDTMGDDDDDETGFEDDLGYVIKYNIIFDNENQQDTWNSFVAWLKGQYDGDTIAERLTQHAVEVMKG